MADDTEHTGAMIALRPSEEDLDRLYAEGGEARDDLHLTLFYLGDGADYHADERAGIVANVASMLARREVEPVVANAFGAAQWNPISDDPAWVLNVGDAGGDDGLVALRGTIGEGLHDGGVELPDQHTPWAPHICIAYSADSNWHDVLVQRLGPVTFDRVCVAFAGEVSEVPLGSTATVASSLGGDGMTATVDCTQCEDDETSDAPVTVGETGPEPVFTTTDTVVTAASPPAPDDCPEGSRRLPNGDCVNEDEYAARAAWYGVLVVEGVATGDGREFSPDALSWADNALLRWQKEGSHGGDHDVTVSVGRIDEVWRVGNQVMGRGVLDIESVDGFEIARRMKDGFAGGISIDADDIQDADVEFIWSEDPDGHDEEDPLLMLFGRPEKVVYHGGRVRAATICDIPAFVEARIQLGTNIDVHDAMVAAATVVSGAVVAAHQTPTTDDAWDASFERRLPNILILDVARQAYAWVGDPVGERVGKINCDYLHHEIRDGEVLGANLTACAVAIAALRSAEHTDEDRAAIYGHLAQHLRDAGQEPPPLDEAEAAAITAALALDAWRPPHDWFTDPQFSVHTGITVTDEGRVYGHAAPWGECHIGHGKECITLPHEANHPYFMTGEVVCADGARVAVGQITVGTGHAPLNYRASHAVEHYDNTGAAVADVAVGNDRYGLWVAGAIRPSVAASRVHELRASGRLSGDWRRIGGSLRLVGLLAVNVPGFPLPVPRARVASGSPTALVAAGAGAALGPGNRLVEPTEDELNRAAMRRVMNVLAHRVRGPHEETEEVSDVQLP